MEPTSSFNVHDGDIIQLYCSFESGYVYGAPNRPGKLDLELDIVHKENIKVADFATFSITLEKKSTQQTSSEVIEKITYGSVVCLKHQASGKFLTANDENEVKLQHESNAKSLFRIISPNHDLAWGEELKDNYSIKLESTFGKNSLVTFDYNHRKKSYKPTLKANINGTVYTIKLYCQEYVKQNPRSIKGGSVINLATLLNIEAYLFGNIDSKIHEDDEDSHEYSLEQPEQDCGDSAQKSQQGKPQLIVGLIKYMEGTFRTLPQQGDTFFQLEKVSEGPPGAPILFGEKCRIKHLFTFKYISFTREKRITKFVLSDLNKDNEASLLFEILPTSDPTDCKDEICDSHKVIFLHSKTSMYLSVNVKPRSDETGIIYDLSLHEDCSSLQTQFEVLLVDGVAQGIMSPLCDAYYAIGITLFLQKSREKLEKDKTLTDVEEDVKARLRELKEANIVHRLKVMLKMLNLKDIMKEVKEVMPKDSIKPVKQILRKDDDGKWWTLDFHIQKITYEKSLKWPYNKNWKAPAPLTELFNEMNKLRIDAKELLEKNGMTDNSFKMIIPCLKNYVNSDAIIDYENGVVCDFNIKEPEVCGLLLLVHLLFIKYKYLQHTPNESDKTKAPAKSSIFEELFGKNSQELCRILSQLIANKDYTISYMSASLLFDIYTKEEMSKANVDIDEEDTCDKVDIDEEDTCDKKMWLYATMTDEHSTLKKMLTKIMDSSSEKRCSSFLDEMINHRLTKDNKPNGSLQEEAFSCGLFHITLEYCVQHKSCSKYSDEVATRILLPKCFEMLQRIAAHNSKIQKELFNHFYEFLRFKKVTSHMILMVNEIFYDNPYLCDKLAEADLGRIFNTAIVIGNHQWTIVLQTIIEYTDHGVVQEYVAQLILENYNDFLGYAKEQEKVNWLNILQCDKLSNEYHLLLNITDLLASCTSKGCQFARLIAAQVFAFDDLVNIVLNRNIKGYRKIPFLCILTWTYLDGRSFTLYRQLLTHMMSTIEKLHKERNRIIPMNVTNRSSYVIQKQNETKDFSDLCYITYGLIPFLSQICMMSLQLRNGNCCTAVQLQSIKTHLLNFKDAYKWECVSEQLLKFECIEKIDLLLEMMVMTDSWSTTLTDKIRCLKTYNAKHELLLSDIEPHMQPIEPNYEEIIGLMKNNQYNKCPVFYHVVSMLKNLVILQKLKRVPCLKRIQLEQMILRTLHLLEKLIEQMKQGTVPWGELCDDTEGTKGLKLAKIILYLNINGAKEHDTLFDLIQHQNNKFIVAVMQLLHCLNSLANAKDVQNEIIKICAEHDCIFIEKVHRLLREAQFLIQKREKLNDDVSTQNADNVDSSASHDACAIIVQENENKENEYITAALNVISLLCDRQQEKMQVAMRNEGFNIVSQVSFIFFYISNHWDDTKVDIAQKTVQALIEMCTGDYINQDIAFKGQVIVSINLQLNMHSDNEEKRKLKSSCIELLEVMLEEIDEKSCTLAKCIANHLEMDKLYQEMLNLFDISNYELLCRAYNVLKRIADYEGISTEKLVEVKEDDKVHQAMWEYCRHRSRSVEIAYKNDTVTQAYFSYDPKIHIKDKSYIQSQIKRSTPQEKLLDFIEWTNAVEKMQSKKDIFTFFRNKIPFLILSRLRQWLLIFLTILLNLIVLFTVYTPLDYNMANGVCTTNSTDNETCSSTSHFQPILSPQISLGSTTVLEILGFVHAALAVMMVIEYFAGNWGSFSPLMELKEHLSCKKIFFSLSKIILGKNITYRLCLGSFKLYLQKPQQSVANDKNTLANEYYQISWSSFQSIYRIFFMVCSLVAWIPVPGLKYMYCLCMLYPFLKFDVVAYISRAIKRSIKQLASVFLLCFVFIYIYAVVSFALLNNYFSKDKDQFCGSLVQCFFTVSRLGLLSTLGSELEIRPNNDYEPNFTLYGFRTFYDLVFFIVVTTLGLNIIIAILVDRFSEMREKSDKVEEDNESRCFICSIERSMFDKDFKKHVTKEHNLWDYMRFIIHVKSLPENSHNALEKYVFDQVNEGKNSIKFFPLYKAKSLPHYEHGDSKNESQDKEEYRPDKELLSLITKDRGSRWRRRTSSYSTSQRQVSFAL